MEVGAGRLRWVIADTAERRQAARRHPARQSGGDGGRGQGLPGGDRAGRRLDGRSGRLGSRPDELQRVTMYDCRAAPPRFSPRHNDGHDPRLIRRAAGRRRAVAARRCFGALAAVLVMAPSALADSTQSSNWAGYAAHSSRVQLHPRGRRLAPAVGGLLAGTPDLLVAVGRSGRLRRELQRPGADRLRARLQRLGQAASRRSGTSSCRRRRGASG